MSTIRLAEDDPDIRYPVAYQLTRSGFDVVEAADGVAKPFSPRELQERVESALARVGR